MRHGVTPRRAAAVAVSAGVLVAIGALEAGESARQLAEVVGDPRLQPSGVGLTALGLFASTAVYLGLGWWAGDDRDALRLGALTGVFAGAVGGSVRAWIIADAVRDIVARYAAVPDPFVPASLAVFVGLAAVVSAVGGAAIAFAGVRIRKLSRARSG
jgi:hypothetical protein